jgi:hypothetical protein
MVSWGRWLVGLCAMAFFFSACSSGTDRTYPRDFSGKQIPPLAELAEINALSGEAQGVTGLWQGESSADCIGDTTANPGRCHAMQYITLTMVQQGGAITGYYKCAFGNEVCRNLDEDGVIRNGVMIGSRLQMRVMLEDGSMCFFTGMPKHDVIEGRYSCLQGGGVIERGAFRTQRSY